MRKSYIIICFAFFFVFCGGDKRVKDGVLAVPVDVELIRFDQLLYSSNVNGIVELRKQYPGLLSSKVSDQQLYESMRVPLYGELYDEVQKEYQNDEVLYADLKLLYQHLKFYFPEFNVPKTIGVISEVNYENKAFLTDSLAVISLDMYLGASHRFYEFPEYIKLNFQKKQIVQDLVSDFYNRSIARVSDKSFVSQMVHAGKELYLKELLLPLTSDAEKMGYTDEQVLWCKDNEVYMWRYLIERELLYSTDKKLLRRFIEPAPFSKFYLEFDNESPGRIGVWLGWRIVRSFMENNDVSVQTMLRMDEKDLFLQSRYKPKK